MLILHASFGQCWLIYCHERPIIRSKLRTFLSLHYSSLSRHPSSKLRKLSTLNQSSDSYLGKNSEIDATLLNKYFLEWTDVLMMHQVKQVLSPFRSMRLAVNVNRLSDALVRITLYRVILYCSSRARSLYREGLHALIYRMSFILILI